MRLRLITCLGLALFLLGPVSDGAAASRAASPEPVGGGFRLDASSGYSVFVSAYSDRADGVGRISLEVSGKGRGAFYETRAVVTAQRIYADLGRLGKIDVAFHPSGRKETLRWCGGIKIPYEPGYYEGTLRFNGEEGYTRADQNRAALSPVPFPRSLCRGSGSGESAGGVDLPGARLRGLSYAGGRILTFQVNKNRPKAPAIFSAELRERHDGVLIERSVHGRGPARSFVFDRLLRTATLRPPPPFSGAASAGRDPDSFSPTWTGSLAVDFPGRSDVRLAGPGVHVSLVHARLTHSSHAFAQI